MNRQLLSETIGNTAKHVKWWSYAAWSLPLVALAILAFESFIGCHDLFSKSLIVISVTFFSISVYWWWWALNKFLDILKAMQLTQEKIDSVKEEIIETRKVVTKQDPRAW